MRITKLPPLKLSEKKLILKIIHESKNLHGADFEATVLIVQKLQEQLKIEKESK